MASVRINEDINSPKLTSLSDVLGVKFVDREKSHPKDFSSI